MPAPLAKADVHTGCSGQSGRNHQTGGKLTTALQHGDRSATRKAVVHATRGSGEYHCGVADGLNSAKHSNERFAESRFVSES